TSNRQEREAKVQMTEGVPPLMRPKWSMQIALEDQQYRSQLDTIEEIPELLQLLPRLQENWPYPSQEALELSRADLAHLLRQPARQVDSSLLLDIVNQLRTQIPRTNGPPPLDPLGARRITEADLAKLPRWARVAFAARCARRLQRLLTEIAPNIPSDEMDGIDHAVTLAEQSAAEGRVLEGVGEAATAALQRAHDKIASKWMQEEEDGGEPPADTLRSVIGEAAAAAAQAATQGDSRAAFEAYTRATDAAYLLASPVLLNGMRRDFLHLEILAGKQNWTDETSVPPSCIPQPMLKLVGLHIRHLRAIRQFDLPQDGLGWQGQVPDLILLGGINGSGKTTLLNFLVDALALITRPIKENFDPILPKSLDAIEAWVDFEMESYEVPHTRLRFLIGDESFISSHKTDNCWWVFRPRNGGGFHDSKGNDLHRLRVTIERWFPKVTIPAVVFMPDDRTLQVPGEHFKAAGRLVDDPRFVYRWRPPIEWKQSLEALLYSLRWEDLNAKAEGRFTEINNFAAYAAALRGFTGSSKYLTFERGELVVKIAGSDARHSLDELSSGEKQVLLLCGELLRRWRPGSLILIDEPELHLHTQWQTKFYQALRYWQKERGGQVILATQSGHLVEIGDSGGLALLGRETP
ncbi:MAG TPA: ATP-binding protein, partial [Gemmataceae bacterium]